MNSFAMDVFASCNDMGNNDSKFHVVEYSDV